MQTAVEAKSLMPAVARRRLKVTTDLPIVTILVWAVFYLPRVWLFGFYEDDWDQLVYQGHMGLLDQLNTWWQLASIRPIAVVLTPILSHVLGPRPMLWQGALAGVALASALLFYRVLHGIGSRSSRTKDVVADLVVAGWLMMPWSVASSGWPALLSQAVVGQLLFFGSFYLATRPRIGPRAALASSGLYLGSLLAYESFYGGFVLIVYFCLVRPWLSRQAPLPRRDTALWLVSGLVAAQLVAILYNRVLATLNFAGSKPWNPGWRDLSFMVTTTFPDRLCLGGEACQFSPGSVGIAGQVVIWLALTLSLVLVVVPGTRRRALAWGLAVCIIIPLAIGTIAMYATAGYGVAGAGYTARTTLSLSVWMVLAAFAVLELIRTALPFRSAGTLVGCLLLAPVLIYLGINFFLEEVEWHRAEELLTTVLDSAPTEQIASLPPAAPLIYVGPTKVKYLEMVGRWTLTDGLYERWPQLRVDVHSPGAQDLARLPSVPTLARRVFSTGGGVQFSWDGTTMKYGIPQYWSETMPAPAVYVWYYDTGTVVPLGPGVTIGE